jgi:hypothetical protein
MMRSIESSPFKILGLPMRFWSCHLCFIGPEPMRFPNFLKITGICVSTLPTTKTVFQKTSKINFYRKKTGFFGGFFQEFPFISYSKNSRKLFDQIFTN